MAGFKAIFGQKTDTATATQLSREPTQRHLYLENSAPTWEELAKIVQQQQKDLECEPTDLETGLPSPDALRRTFKKGVIGEPRVKLYRDHATWCPYCHKIVLQLEEKKIVRFSKPACDTVACFVLALCSARREGPRTSPEKPSKLQSSKRME
jgi:thiol-disulfide isomerase/thioredoxin